MDQHDREVIADIQDRMGNGRPPCEPGHFQALPYDSEDGYYDRYEVRKPSGDADSERGAVFTASDGYREYTVTIQRADMPTAADSRSQITRLFEVAHGYDADTLTGFVRES